MSENTVYEYIGEATEQVLDLNVEDTQCKLYGYKRSSVRLLFYHILGLSLLGFPYFIFHWFKSLKTIKYQQCSLKQATIVLIKDDHGHQDLIHIQTDNNKLPNVGHVVLRFFLYRFTKFVWIPQQQTFGPLELLIPPLTVDQYFHNREGLFDTDYIDLLKLYGPNKIEIEVKSYWKLFIEEIFNPFYVFQACSVILWCFDLYLIYAFCVFLLTLFSVITALRQTRNQSASLHALVESTRTHSVQVIRQNLLSVSVTHDIDPIDLVPGDLIIIPKCDFKLPCDAVLLTGQCLVNESMLTGESVPVTKTSLLSDSEIYNVHLHKRHTLFSGTQMIQSRYYEGEDVLARIVKTGFRTTQGALVKSILFPNAVGVQFYKDSLKFVLVLSLIASLGTAYSLYLYSTRKSPLREMIIRSLDIITIVVPPALPAAITVGIVYSQNRLKKLKIFCISPPKINVAGKIKIACFDKTGTLTQDGLDMHSVLLVKNSRFSAPIHDCQLLDNNQLVQAMATCHSITQVDGILTGDPLDLSMFEFTEWELEEPGANETERFDMLAPMIVKFEEDPDLEIGIIRQFPFSSTLQCMSVICRKFTSRFMVAYVKGAPEKIASMCKPETLPQDFTECLTKYTALGYRVIALAFKEMPKFKWKSAQITKRHIVECDLNFLGLLIMQNTLKSNSTPVIRTLHNAKIRTLMITGDNIRTAISVARNCQMVAYHEQIIILETRAPDDNPNSIPKLVMLNVGSAASHNESNDFNINFDTGYHFAIDGKTWTKIKQFYPDLLPSLLVRTTVFARFQPDQKTQLITSLQSLDYVVAMVGDGANDCGALKAAHVGISLSQAEASVAAPFTSSIQDISCLVHLMKEGRCALVTSFAVFKFMALYSLIQFTTVLILYRGHTELGDTQFLFIDLIITTTLAVTIGRQGPSQRLGLQRPMGSLVAAKNLIPILLQILVCVLIQIGAVFYLFQQKWFEPVDDNGDDTAFPCWENTVLFTVSSFQYVILACVYSKGAPFRKRLITNFWFLVNALALTTFQVWLLVGPTRKVAEFFEIMYLPHNAPKEQVLFRYFLLLFPICHLVVAILIEVAVADRKWLGRLIHFVKRKKLPKNRYKLLLLDESTLHSWVDT